MNIAVSAKQRPGRTRSITFSSPPFCATRHSLTIPERTKKKCVRGVALIEQTLALRQLANDGVAATSGVGALKLGEVEIFDDIGDVAGQVMLGQSVLQSCTEGGEGLAIPVYWLESGHERGEVRDGSDFIRPGSGR